MNKTEIEIQKALEEFDQLLDKLGFIPVSEIHVKKCKSDRRKMKKLITQALYRVVIVRDKEWMKIISDGIKKSAIKDKGEKE